MILETNDANIELTKVLNIVKGTLKEHKLFDQIIIEEQKDGFFVKFIFVDKQENINRFKSLAGTAISAEQILNNFSIWLIERMNEMLLLKQLF